MFLGTKSYKQYKYTSPIFHFNRIVAKRELNEFSLFGVHLGRTNDFKTKNYATFLNDTVEAKNRLYAAENGCGWEHCMYTIRTKYVQLVKWNIY